MRFLKKMLAKLSRPSKSFIALFCAIFVIALTGTLLLLALIPEQGVLHYLAYAFSAVCLGYFVYVFIKFILPKSKQIFLNFLKRHKFTNDLLQDYNFRTIIFATLGFIINAAYVILLTVMSIVARSVWNGAIAAFYFVLIIIKSAVLLFGRKYKNEKLKQTKIYCFCGIMLNLLTFAMSGIIVLINTSDMYFKYAGIMIYIVAVFTFYKIITAIIQFFKARKQDNLTIQAIRNVNLVSALYSILVLQVAMFQAFGESAKHFSNNITGGVIAALIFAISLYMIINSRLISKQKIEN